MRFIFPFIVVCSILFSNDLSAQELNIRNQILTSKNYFYKFRAKDSVFIRTDNQHGFYDRAILEAKFRISDSGLGLFIRRPFQSNEDQDSTIRLDSLYCHLTTQNGISKLTFYSIKRGKLTEIVNKSSLTTDTVTEIKKALLDANYRIRHLNLRDLWTKSSMLNHHSGRVQYTLGDQIREVWEDEANEVRINTLINEFLISVIRTDRKPNLFNCVKVETLFGDFRTSKRRVKSLINEINRSEKSIKHIGFSPTFSNGYLKSLFLDSLLICADGSPFYYEQENGNLIGRRSIANLFHVSDSSIYYEVRDHRTNKLDTFTVSFSVNNSDEYLFKYDQFSDSEPQLVMGKYLIAPIKVDTVLTFRRAVQDSKITIQEIIVNDFILDNFYFSLDTYNRTIKKRRKLVYLPPGYTGVIENVLRNLIIRHMRREQYGRYEMLVRVGEKYYRTFTDKRSIRDFIKDFEASIKVNSQ